MRYLGTSSLAIVVFIFSGCGKPPETVSSPPHKTIIVFAAASLTESFTEIGRQFEAANPQVSVEFNFGGSQQLLSQLQSGAQADLFASASEAEMETAQAGSLLMSHTSHDFASNKLVVIFPISNPGKIGTLKDLARPGIKIDLADVSVPAGKYASQTIDKMAADPALGAQFKTQFQANIVSREENVKAVLTKVRLGEADAGIVYVTDVTPAAATEVGTLDVPDKYNQIGRYPIALLARSPQPDWAEKFEDFVLSDPGRQVLHQFKFLPAASDGQ